MTVVQLKKIRNRVYDYVHIETGRVFRLMGHPSQHRWWASEMVKQENGTVKEYPTILEDRNSMLKIVGRINAYVLKYPMPKEKKKTAQNLPKVIRHPMGHGFVRPENAMKFKVIRQDDRSALLSDTNGINYKFQKERDGWSVYSYREKRFIIRDIDTREHAVIELQIYLNDAPAKIPTLIGEAYLKIDERLTSPPGILYYVICYIGELNVPTTVIYEDLVEADILERTVSIAAKLAWNAGYNVQLQASTFVTYFGGSTLTALIPAPLKTP